MPGPKHRIVVEKARRTFGLSLHRGHDGVRAYIEQLVPLMVGR